MANDITAADVLGGVHAAIKDGKMVDSSTKTSTTKSTAADKSGGALDKDAFLQLLVTQMKYQDPLEPTDNTEYVSQLATFSTLEEMQNMGSSMDMQRASSLVGQYVIVEKTESTGATKQYEGLVDYVTYQGGKTYLSIEGTLYDFDNLVTVADADYTVAVKLHDAFAKQLYELPGPDRVTTADFDDVDSLMRAYSAMDAYQKTFLTTDELSAYSKYAEWYLKQIEAKAGADGEGGDESGSGVEGE